MECVNITLDLTFHLQQALHSGQGVKTGLQLFLKHTNQSNILTEAVVHLLNKRQAGDIHLFERALTIHQRALLDLVQRGLGGEPIGIHLENLRTEIELALQLEIERHICLIPFLSFLPLIFFHLPALLAITVFPLVRDFSEALLSW